MDTPSSSVPFVFPNAPVDPIYSSATNLSSPSSLRTISVSFLCGCLGGVANILSSHSFDTIKVRMQILDLKFVNCFKYMVKNEGIGALYKGITSPLFNVPLIYAIYFGAYETGKWLQGVDPKKEVTISEAVTAGALAGFAVTAVMTPVELVKCRLQMLGTGSKTKTVGAFKMANQIVKARGIKELYKGSLITLCREIPATAVYFGIYEYLSRELKAAYGSSQLITLTAGGLAGLLSWAASYPQDVVKTKLQCDADLIRKYPQNKRFRDGGIINCAKDTWRRGGVRGFTKGFSACSLKGIIAEASTFFVYENLKSYSKH